MGYQEFMISVTDKNKDEIAKKISDSLDANNFLYSLGFVATLKEPLKIYDLDGEVLNPLLRKGDKFLVLTGDRHECDYILQKLNITYYSIETIIRCAIDQGYCNNYNEYSKIFDDEKYLSPEERKDASEDLEYN